jgi:hypothetical protein
MTNEELHRLARLGAKARLEELKRELNAIHAAFPDLRDGRAGRPKTGDTANGRNAAPNSKGAVEGVVAKRRRPKISREARQRIAAAQRRRWAEWRAKKGNGANR